MQKSYKYLKKNSAEKETFKLFMRMQIYEHIYDLFPPFSHTNA